MPFTLIILLSGERRRQRERGSGKDTKKERHFIVVPVKADIDSGNGNPGL